MPAPQDLSELLGAWSGGDEQALKDLVALVYPDLRRIARNHLGRGGGDHTLESGVLANEAYLKLFQARGIQCHHRAHFFALCAQIIRRIVVDHSRKHWASKRGGEYVQAPLEEARAVALSGRTEVVALDEALSALSKMDPRKARVVELRYFGGLRVEETAEVLNISAETVTRDWKMAKAWLFRELTSESKRPG